MESDIFPPPLRLVANGPAGPFAEPRPNMQGRYLLRSQRSAQAMGWLDRLLSLTPITSQRVPARLDRILVANWGHLGDVVTTTGAIRALRERHPGVRIGMIVANAGRPAIEKTGLVDRVHVVDHWWVSRAEMSSRDKRRHFRNTRKQALREIREERYQAAIDFYPFFPPAHPLFYRAGIPIRVGYSSGGFSPLLTHPIAWADAKLPVAAQYGALLDALHPEAPFTADALRPRRERETLVPLAETVSAAGPYIVLHPGAGAIYKEWPIARWRELVRELLQNSPGQRLVITGAGQSEKAVAAELSAVSPAIINMAGEVDWEGFVSIIAHAALVVCPDTATGHVAASLDVPVVSIFTGTNVAEQWQPFTPNNRLLVNAVLCAPCNRPGCEAMACIRPIESKQVLAEVQHLLSSGQAR